MQSYNRATLDALTSQPVSYYLGLYYVSERFLGDRPSVFQTAAWKLGVRKTARTKCIYFALIVNVYKYVEPLCLWD